MSGYDSTQFLGPFGGLLSITFGAGCVAGWAFAMKMVSARIASMKTEIATLKAKVERLDDFLLRGMERQLGQIRESSLRVIVDGQERDQQI